MKRILVTVVGLVLGLGACRAAAVTFTVDTTADAVDAAPGDGSCATAGGACSLRAAVQEANALAGPDAITLPAGTYVLTLAGTDDASASGDLDVHESLAITGAGAATSVIDGNTTSRVVEVAPPLSGPSPSLTVAGVTVRNGNDVGADPCNAPHPFVTVSIDDGAGLCAAFATLEVVDSVVENNQGTGVVGFFGATVTLTRTTVRDNLDPVSHHAPGILVNLASLIVTDSAISGNEDVGIVAGLGDAGFAVTVRNSTLSANGTTGISAGVACEAGIVPPCAVAPAVTLNNVTISGHTGAAVRNGLIFVGGSPPIPDGGTSPVFVSNSILAGNGTECAGDLSDGRLTSRGYNLLQTLTGCAVVGDTTGNLVGLPAGLGPLASNGGPTATHALGGTSVAQNAGNPAAPGSGGDTCEVADERGVTRPVGGRCDMGAYEGSCGNAFTDPGEECDDGNPTDGDGCQHNCALPACGDGVVEGAEQCDDGGTAAGDCCSPTCQLDPASTPCTSDGNACTDDVCNAAGVCTHPDNTAPCDDGDPCTLGDTCASGSCAPQSTCGPCTVCTPGGCAPPAATCTAADSGRSRITIADNSDPTRDRVAWTWKATGPVTAADFGDPTTFSLGWRLCAYDASGQAALLAVATEPCDTVFGCWTATPKGFRYEQGSGIPGTVRMRLTTGSPARIRVKAKGTTNGVPALPLGLPVRVGLYHADLSLTTVHGCWDATYAAARKNSTTIFRAKAD